MTLGGHHACPDGLPAEFSYIHEGSPSADYNESYHSSKILREREEATRMKRMDNAAAVKEFMREMKG